ncbi:hypothetical protein ABIA48_000680 [Pseudomonas sp. S30_BP2TU TE3576]|jgi:hypothetical protein
MEKKAQYNFKRPGLLTPLGVLLTMTPGTATLRASPIDDERQPEPSDPSAYYDEPADEPAASSKAPKTPVCPMPGCHST